MNSRQRASAPSKSGRGRPSGRRRLAFLVAAVSVTALSGVGTGASASTAPNAAADAPSCGAAVPKPGGGDWTCTFADEFNGTTLDTSKWSPQLTATSNFRNGPECYVDTPANLSVSGGALNLTARKEAQPFSCATTSGSFASQYTSASVSTYGKFAQAYGRFEIRAKFPAATVAGLQSSLWLWPETLSAKPWPSSGEIDIAEAFSKYPDRVIPYVHYVSLLRDPHATNNYCLISDVNAFHTYVAEWTPTTITITYDGKTCLSDTWKPLGMAKPAPFNQPFMVALTQALGQGTNAFNPATTPLPATTSVDYVHVWK